MNVLSLSEENTTSSVKQLCDSLLTQLDNAADNLVTSANTDFSTDICNELLISINAASKQLNGQTEKVTGEHYTNSKINEEEISTLQEELNISTESENDHI